tara:strand:+ start:500 stop:823 length:324 start_codon:yes stop_codon:yes gene_type:complete
MTLGIAIPDLLRPGAFSGTVMLNPGGNGSLPSFCGKVVGVLDGIVVATGGIVALGTGAGSLMSPGIVTGVELCFGKVVAVLGISPGGNGRGSLPLGRVIFFVAISYL